MKAPWFQVIEVVEARGRSMADIAADVLAVRNMTLGELRRSTSGYAKAARREVITRLRAERPDLSSRLVGDFLHRESSTIRCVWRSIDERRPIPEPAPLGLVHTIEDVSKREESVMRHWNEQEKHIVAGFLRRGLTAGQIARFMGRSRCAVIGLVNRHPELKAIGFAWRKAA